jgi:hypothetical protein
MRIRLFDRFLKRTEPEVSLKVKEQATLKANTAGVASVRDSFVKARNENFFSGKFLEAGDLQKEQDYGRPKQNDDVLVEFQGGETRNPYVQGSLWTTSDTPPETKSDSDDDKKKKD